jgi:hypothetical protein
MQSNLVLTEPSFVETLTAWSTLGAAVATVISAGFIAWQIRLTRKSVQAMDRTLDIARQEFDRGRHLEIEARKARIDAEMPRLFVSVDYVWEHAYFGDETEPDPYSTVPAPKRIPDGHEFALPRDAARLVSIAFTSTVANDGPGRAKVFLDAPRSPRHAGRRSLVIAAGDQAREECWRTQTVQEWIDVYEARRAGRSDDVDVAQVHYFYPGDVAANERHDVVQGGTVLEPDPQRLGVWHVGDFRARLLGDPVGIGTEVMPFTRTYWASRRRSQPLDGN